MNHGPRAHGAGLDGDKYFTAGQAMVAGPGCRLSQRDDLGMGRGIVVPQIAILPLAEDFAILDY